MDAKVAFTWTGAADVATRNEMGTSVAGYWALGLLCSPPGEFGCLVVSPLPFAGRGHFPARETEALSVNPAAPGKTRHRQPAAGSPRTSPCPNHSAGGIGLVETLVPEVERRWEGNETEVSTVAQGTAFTSECPAVRWTRGQPAVDNPACQRQGS